MILIYRLLMLRQLPLINGYYFVQTFSQPQPSSTPSSQQQLAIPAHKVEKAQDDSQVSSQPSVPVSKQQAISDHTKQGAQHNQVPASGCKASSTELLKADAQGDEQERQEERCVPNV